MSTEAQVQNSLVRLRSRFATATFENIAARLAVMLGAKYDPGQPRAPAGSSEGGQWTDAGGGSEGGLRVEVENDGGRSASAERILSEAPRLAAGGMSYRRCVDICYGLLERIQPRGTTNINQWDFIRCLNACLGK